jgi:hypothetical protein
MATWTLYDGTEVELPDNISDGQALNALARAFPAKASAVGVSPDIEREYDLTSGVRNASARFSQALAQGNAKEIKAAADADYGVGNWEITDWGQLAIKPQGLRNIGIEPKDDRTVVVDEIGTSVYDLVDIFPELVIGTASVAGEVLGPQVFVPGSGAAAGAATRGFLSALSARRNAAAAIGAGTGDVVGNLGVEAVQLLRGEQYETPAEIFSRAGSQGAIVAGLTFGLGLPLSGVGALSGKVKNITANRLTTGTNQGISVTAESAAQARLDIIDTLKQSGRFTDAEIDDIVPVLTIKHMLGDTGSFAGKFATVLEGIGAKNLGDRLPAKAMEFLNKVDNVVRPIDPVTGQPRSVVELADLVKQNLSKSELAQAKKGLDGIADLHKQLAPVEAAKDISELTALIQGALKQQLRHGQEQFSSPRLYGTLEEPNPNLQLGNLSGYAVKNTDVAEMINTIARELGTDNASDAINFIASVDSAFAKKLDNVIDIEGNRAKAKSSTDVPDLIDPETGDPLVGPRFAEGIAPGGKEAIAGVSAADLYQLTRQISRASANKKASRKQLRDGVMASEPVLDMLDKYSSGFSAELKRVNKAYREFITPFQQSMRNITETSAQTTQQYVDDLVTGRKPRLFQDIVEQLDAALKGTDDISRADNLATADQLLGEVASQYMRYIREQFDLTADAIEAVGLDAVRENAKKALAQIRKMEKADNTPRFKKAINRLFNTKAMNDYKKALKDLSEGKPEGAAQLGHVLSFKEAGNFVDNISGVASNLRSANLAAEASKVNGLRAVDQGAGDFYNELFYAELYSRLLKIGGLQAAQRNAALKNWADDIVAANNASADSMKVLLGDKFYKPMLDMANVIQGALNIDPSAGAINAAGLPIAPIRGLINGNLLTALKPVTLMYTLRGFGPGQPGWKKTSDLLISGKSPEEINKAMAPYLGTTVKSANKLAAGVLSGRTGLLAATVSAYMNEADDELPPEGTPIVPRVVRQSDQEIAEQQRQQTVSDFQDQALGKAMADVIRAIQGQAPTQVPDVGVSLSEGARIAGAR